MSARMSPSMKSWILFYPELPNLRLHRLFVLITNAMGCHGPVVQSGFTNERLLPFFFTPCTNYFHGDLVLSKVNAEYPSSENRQCGQ